MIFNPRNHFCVCPLRSSHMMFGTIVSAAHSQPSLQPPRIAQGIRLTSTNQIPIQQLSQSSLNQHSSQTLHHRNTPHRATQSIPLPPHSRYLPQQQHVVQEKQHTTTARSVSISQTNQTDRSPMRQILSTTPDRQPIVSNRSHSQFQPQLSMNGSMRVQLPYNHRQTPITHPTMNAAISANATTTPIKTRNQDYQNLTPQRLSSHSPIMNTLQITQHLNSSMRPINYHQTASSPSPIRVASNISLLKAKSPMNSISNNCSTSMNSINTTCATAITAVASPSQHHRNTFKLFNQNDSSPHQAKSQKQQLFQQQYPRSMTSIRHSTNSATSDSMSYLIQSKINNQINTRSITPPKMTIPFTLQNTNQNENHHAQNTVNFQDTSSKYTSSSQLVRNSTPNIKGLNVSSAGLAQKGLIPHSQLSLSPLQAIDSNRQQAQQSQQPPAMTPVYNAVSMKKFQPEFQASSLASSPFFVKKTPQQSQRQPPPAQLFSHQTPIKHRDLQPQQQQQPQQMSQACQSQLQSNTILIMNNNDCFEEKEKTHQERKEMQVFEQTIEEASQELSKEGQSSREARQTKSPSEYLAKLKEQMSKLSKQIKKEGCNSLVSFADQSFTMIDFSRLSSNMSNQMSEDTVQQQVSPFDDSQRINKDQSPCSFLSKTLTKLQTLKGNTNNISSSGQMTQFKDRFIDGSCSVSSNQQLQQLKLDASELNLDLSALTIDWQQARPAYQIYKGAKHKKALMISTQAESTLEFETDYSPIVDGQKILLDKSNGGFGKMILNISNGQFIQEDLQ